MASLQQIFGDYFEAVNTSSPNYDKPVDIVEFPTVNRADSEPLCLIWPNIKEGPWIAGGAALQWYQGLPVGESDIDVFCANARQAAAVIENIKSYGRHTVKFESDNAVTIQYHQKDHWENSWTIQVITRRYFSSLEEIIDSFDISVCQVGTAGNEWVLGKDTARDIRERNLRFKMPLHPDALKRLTKYWTYGYRPVEGTLEAIQNNPDAKWQFSAETEDYQNAF